MRFVCYRQAPLWRRVWVRIGRALGLVPLWMAIAGGPGCVRHEPTRAEVPAARVALLSPALGDTVLGETVLEAQVIAFAGVDEVTFRIDGAPLAALRQPPWVAMWRPVLSDTPSVHWVEVEARDREIDGCVTARTEVVALRDVPPGVQVALPRRGYWIERGADVTLEATGLDREDGVLSASALHWRGETAEASPLGNRFDWSRVPLGPVHLVAIAEDHRGQTSSLNLRLHAFEYAEPRSPEVALENLTAALRALDANGTVAAFSEDFELVPCHGAGGAHGEAWSRDETAARIRRFFDGPSVSRVLWSWHPEPPSYSEERGRSVARVQCSAVEFSFVQDGSPTETTGDRGGSEEASSGGRVLLEWILGADARWRLRRWEDRAPGSGHAFSVYLARGARTIPRQPLDQASGARPEARAPAFTEAAGPLPGSPRAPRS